MENKITNLKDLIFNQVIMQLDRFNQDFIFEDDFMYDENYYSPKDFVLSFTPEEYDILLNWSYKCRKQTNK